MADLPASVGYMTVTGRLILGYADSNDAGSRPDMAPGVGTVTFNPDIASGFPLVSIPDALMIAAATIKCSLDDNGEIVAPADGSDNNPSDGAAPGVILIAPLQPGILSNTDWTWTATFTPAAGQKWKAFSRTFTGAPGDILNIATLIPAPTSPGSELVTWNAVVTQATAARDAAVAAAAAAQNGGGPSLEVYDEFSHHTDGALAGNTPLSGDVWQTTGADGIVVANGRATSAGTGYAWQALDAPVAGMACDVLWSGSGSNNSMTLAITSGITIDLNNLAVHLNFGPVGFNLTVREAGGAFVTVLFDNWRVPMLVDGATVYRIGFRRRGATVILTGPSGETYAATDERIGRLAGRVAFWEPGGATTKSELVRAGAYSDSATAYTEANLTGYDAGVGFILGASGRVAGSRGTTAEASIGADPVSGFPAVLFGPVVGGTVAARIYADQFGDLHAPGKLQLGDGGDAVIYGGGPDGVGVYFSNGYDTGIFRAAGGVLRMRGQGVLRQGSGTTAQRPAASTCPDAQYRDTTLGTWIYSDGTNWRRVSNDAIA